MTYWAAREFVGQYLPATPLIRVERLSEILGCDYYVKCENLQPVGAFKVRGGVNLVGTASEEEKQAGLVSASTGNHGQSIAYAGRLFGARVIIYAPAENVNQTKIQAMRDLGAEVRFHGSRTRGIQNSLHSRKRDTFRSNPSFTTRP